jgi:hypothetical protein
MTKSNKIKTYNFGITSCGFKKTTEIILDLKTAKLFSKMFHNLYSVEPNLRNELEDTLNGHIVGCTEE